MLIQSWGVEMTAEKVDEEIILSKPAAQNKAYEIQGLFIFAEDPNFSGAWELREGGVLVLPGFGPAYLPAYNHAASPGKGIELKVAAGGKVRAVLQGVSRS